MTKTLGQVAFDAWRKDLGLSGPHMDWKVVKDSEQQAWQAAAEAVVKHLGEVPCGIDCGRGRAVIEAAKALAARLNRDVPGFCLGEINRVVDAVEALQEVEGG